MIVGYAVVIALAAPYRMDTVEVSLGPPAKFNEGFNPSAWIDRAGESGCKCLSLKHQLLALLPRLARRSNRHDRHETLTEALAALVASS